MKLSLRLCVIVLICCVSIPVAARQTKSAELLYRLDDTLYLSNITTGQTTALPDIKTAPSDGWLWSPDGHYLLSNASNLIRIYDVDNQRWLQIIELDTDIGFIAWSYDSSHIAFVKHIRYDNSPNYDELWVFDLKTGSQQMLYKTQDVKGNIITDTGISGISWSPDNQFLVFKEQYSTVAYAASAGLYLASADGKTVNQLITPFQGVPNPIWSPDSKWFLLNIRHTFYHPEDPTAHSDILLYGIDDQIYGLTNTPDVPKQNLGWSADGKQIQFDTDTQSVSIELQSVINSGNNDPLTSQQTVSPLPPKRQPLGDGEEIFSPDGEWVVFVFHKQNNLSNLVIARSDGTHSSSLAESVTFLGWRPS